MAKKPAKPALNLDALTLDSTPAAQLRKGYSKDAMDDAAQKLAEQTADEFGFDDDGLSLFDTDAPDGDDGAEQTIGLDELEANLETGISEMLAAFQRSSAGEAATRDANINTRYWIALAFQTEAAKREFLTEVGWIDLGDKYFCGEEIATRLGIAMTIPLPDMPNWRAKRTLSALSTDRSDAANRGDTE